MPARASPFCVERSSAYATVTPDLIRGPAYLWPGDAARQKNSGIPGPARGDEAEKRADEIDQSPRITSTPARAWMAVPS